MANKTPPVPPTASVAVASAARATPSASGRPFGATHGWIGALRPSKAWGEHGPVQLLGGCDDLPLLRFQGLPALELRRPLEWLERLKRLERLERLEG